MKRSTRLDKLVDINTQFESLAAASLGSVRGQYQKQKDQLIQLQNYRTDYTNKLNERLKTTSSALEIQDFTNFIAALDDAIKQQQNVVTKCATEMDAAEKNWLSKRVEVKKLQRVADTARQKEGELERKKEQKESDETRMKAAN